MLFADDTLYHQESEKDLQKLVNEFNTVCVRRKLRVNEGKSKVMVFEKRKNKVIDFTEQYRMKLENQKQCKGWTDNGRGELIQLPWLQPVYIWKHGTGDSNLNKVTLYLNMYTLSETKDIFI